MHQLIYGKLKNFTFFCKNPLTDLLNDSFVNVFRGSIAKFDVPLGMGGRRDMDTLDPLIIVHIKLGKTIMTDGWSSYNLIVSLTDLNY